MVGPVEGRGLYPGILWGRVGSRVDAWWCGGCLRKLDNDVVRRTKLIHKVMDVSQLVGDLSLGFVHSFACLGELDVGGSEVGVGLGFHSWRDIHV